MNLVKLFILFGFLAAPFRASSDTVLANRTIRSQTIITALDVTILKDNRPSAINRLTDVLGMESRVVLYEGRPINAGDIGPPAIIKRNQVVSLVYSSGPLSIATEARSLDRAGVGDTIKVMNLASRNTISGVVLANGTVIVQSQ